MLSLGKTPKKVENWNLAGKRDFQLFKLSVIWSKFLSTLEMEIRTTWSLLYVFHYIFPIILIDLNEGCRKFNAIKSKFMINLLHLSTISFSDLKTILVREVKKHFVSRGLVWLFLFNLNQNTWFFTVSYFCLSSSYLNWYHHIIVQEKNEFEKSDQTESKAKSNTSSNRTWKSTK